MEPDGTAAPPLTYAPAGATCPADAAWPDDGLRGHRRHEETVLIGHGEDDWRAASEAVLRWGVKTRSGFRVAPRGAAGERVTEDAVYRITAGRGPLSVHEPVRVVAVVDTADARGFAYGTLPGHPVCGEEAFVVRRTPDGRVTLTLRSLTAPAAGWPWRPLFPVLLLAQRLFRRRYRRALRRAGARAVRGPAADR
ncbi:DUF1990 family protein [uncultured Streptomyces sp.]|uniref:DUF1990 family protein n=1 Tax=uncultured Streptomyces sp. TaxID=174707 RepID=UPI00263449D6|nr:DUF1990 domain-containing protein [uncultured Streptomyces sp.]